MKTYTDPIMQDLEFDPALSYFLLSIFDDNERTLPFGTHHPLIAYIGPNYAEDAHYEYRQVKLAGKH